MAPTFPYPEQNAMAALIEDQGAAVAHVTSLGECRSCGAAVYWAVTHNGKNVAYDEEPNEKGKPVVHFATCPDAKKWRKTK